MLKINYSFFLIGALFIFYSKFSAAASFGTKCSEHSELGCQNIGEGQPCTNAGGIKQNGSVCLLRPPKAGEFINICDCVQPSFQSSDSN